MKEKFIIDTNIFDKIVQCERETYNIIKKRCSDIRIVSWTQIELDKTTNKEKRDKLLGIFNDLNISIREDVNIFPFKFPMVPLDDNALKVYRDMEIKKYLNNDDAEQYAVKNTDARITSLAKQKSYIVVTEDVDLRKYCCKHDIVTYTFNDFLEHLNNDKRHKASLHQHKIYP